MPLWKASVERMPALACLDTYSWLGRNTPTKTREVTGAASPKSLTESSHPSPAVEPHILASWQH